MEKETVLNSYQKGLVKVNGRILRRVSLSTLFALLFASTVFAEGGAVFIPGARPSNLGTFQC